MFEDHIGVKPKKYSMNWNFFTYGIVTNDPEQHIKNGTAQNAPDFTTLYTPGAKGYIDYHVLFPYIHDQPWLILLFLYSLSHSSYSENTFLLLPISPNT